MTWQARQRAAVSKTSRESKGSNDRGEKAKTGPNQGVIIDSPTLRDDLRKWVAKLRPNDLVFPLPAYKFRETWKAVKAKEGLEWLGPPHHLRHAGASRDAESNKRSLELIRRRGRWKSSESVQRYTKSWLLIRERARLTPDQLTRGRALAQLRGQPEEIGKASKVR